MIEASGNDIHLEQRSNPAPRTTKPAVGVPRPQPLPNAYPAFYVLTQEGYAMSYNAIAALEEEHSQLNVKNVIGRDGRSVLLPKDVYTYLTLDALTSDSVPALKLIRLDPKTQLTKGVVRGYSLRMIPLGCPWCSYSVSCRWRRPCAASTSKLASFRLRSYFFSIVLPWVSK